MAVLLERSFFIMRNLILLFFSIPLVCNSQTLLQEKATIEVAKSYLDSLPITITSSECARSEGGLHDFYSEGDYWWPDPENPEGPYIRRDGESNPDNFIKHRLLIMRFSEIAGRLGAAYSMTNDQEYAEALIEHCKAWFVNEETVINPHLS